MDLKLADWVLIGGRVVFTLPFYILNIVCRLPLSAALWYDRARIEKRGRHYMKKRLCIRSAFLLALLLTFMLSACTLLHQKEPLSAPPSPSSPPSQSSQTSPPIEQPSGNSAEPEVKESYLTLIAVGDNLIHNTVFRAAKTKNGYDFSSMYTPVQSLIRSADIAFVNQEAPLATDIYAASGYPNFNAPQEVGRDLVKEGFDIVNQANNHAMDKGSKGVLSTVEFWKNQSGVIMTGMYDSEADRDAPKILEKNGIKVGILSYTYGTNGISLPADKPYLVSLIDRNRMKKDIAALRDKCDVLVVSMHWGVEYNLGVTDEQRDLAKFLTGQGADLIIGHHPHVIEPAEWITAANGNKAFCVYSLGNFISSQQKRVAMLGGMLRVRVKKDADQKISLENPGILPLVTHYEKNGTNYKVYPLYDYNDTLAKKHAVNAFDKPISMNYLKNTAREVYGNFLKLDR